MSRRAIPILALLFVLTGAGGLLAEQVFEKLLTALVGASTPAGAVVLAVYFGGLTLGGWLFSRRPSAHPLRLYGWLEVGVAAWALLLRFGGDKLGVRLVPLLRLGADHFWLLQWLRGLAAGAWILPPTILMGMSFPAVVGALEAWGIESPRKKMAGFYALNLLGALAGALAGPFYCFPRLGLHGTLAATALLDGAAGLAALALARGAAVAPLPPRAKASGEFAGARALVALAFVSGFLFFGLEVLWTHLIATAIGNSVYAFAAMLAAVLAGLLAGGWGATRFWPEAARPSRRDVGRIFLLGAASLAAQFLLWPLIPNSFIALGDWARMHRHPIESFAAGEALRWSAAGLLLLPSAAVLGVVYPLLFRLEHFPERGRAALAARMGAANSVGCVLGALACGFFLIPVLGSEWMLRLAVVALAGCGFALAGRGPPRARARFAPALLAALALLLPRWNRLGLTSGGHVYFRTYFVGRDTTLEYFHEDTRGGITTVVANPDGAGGKYLTLLTNGKFQANDSGEAQAQTGLALVPLMHARKFDDALVIGLGSGHTAALVNRAGFARIEIAEIAPGIVGAARTKFASLNDRVLASPRVTLRLEDGRNHLLLTGRRYDLITMEISSVWFAGASNLYSREFYALAKSRLKPGGVMQQWIQLHHISTDELGSVMRAMREEFPSVSFWVVGGQGILVATDGPQTPQPAALSRLLACDYWRGGVPRETQLARLLASRLLAPGDLDGFLAASPAPANTDSNRRLEYATPKYNLDPRDLATLNLTALARHASWPPYETAFWPERLRAEAGALGPAAYRAALGLPAGG